MRALTLGWVLASRERGGLKRLGGIAAGVAVGVALLLLVLAAYQALGDRSARSTWPLDSAFKTGQVAELEFGDDTVWVAPSGMLGGAGDYFNGEAITRVSIAATPDSTVAVPGIDRAPRPGEYYASPALAALIDAAPADQLGDRFGTRIGTVGPEALLGPETKLAIVGEDAATVEPLLGASLHTELSGIRFPSPAYAMIAIVGGIAVLFPVAVLISIVTKLGQAARAERFSTIRLIGASPRLVAVLAGLEAMIPALLGAIAGIGLFFAVRPLAALVEIEGSRFFLSDLSVPVWAMVLAALGTALLAGVVAFLTALRAGLGPLGGSREQRERRPRWWSLVPLALGAAVIAAPAVAASGLDIGVPDIAILVGFVLITVGIVLAGPWLAAVVSGAGAARARSAAGVLAMRRIARHPRATFRSVSGLVLALFVVTVFAVGTTTETAEEVADVPPTELVPVDALTASVGIEVDAGRQTAGLTRVAETQGVDRVISVGWYDAEAAGSNVPEGADEALFSGGFVMEADDARAIGLDPGTAEWLWLEQPYFSNFELGRDIDTIGVPAAAAETATPTLVMVLTDGQPGSLERARTAMTTNDLSLSTLPATRAESTDAGATRFARQYVSLAWIGILIATLISVISLSVSTIAGMIDRRRQLGLLRLSGMPAATLRRMIVIETALPLATVFLITIGLGFLTAWAVVVALSGGDRQVTLPDASYLGLVGVCLGLAAVAILVVFRSVRSELPLAATRFE
ncbi:FtsX-like permease family protein [Leucobacter komagatae]|uniref:FtsX-like permease family protein n=1 Tax=Leucobacter komagatae TaxID=55969 RepID=A0A542XXV5_9MICO|nr:FtsX-like permease family protein [Leucobacter komagatae]TQL40669.1 FtsX-like permease family protein [Leucobacter komagatae]